MRILGVEHIGIAVGNIDECIARLEKVFGFRCEGRQTIEASKVEVAFFKCGETKLELVTPTDETSPIHKFLMKRGNGIHHICLDVEGITDWVDSLVGDGVDMIDEVPRKGAAGKNVAFISPGSLCDILIELSEAR
jgi:methylmalonyl-CoA/ethylmalonyl-CoA epimerase